MGLWEILKGEQPGLINTILHYQNKGQFGEYSTEFALTNNNLDGRFSVHRNVYIPYKNGTCEIDLLMFHERGIFVFESKNYAEIRPKRPDSGHKFIKILRSLQFVYNPRKRLNHAVCR